MNTKVQTARGFTLIEILVVIGIIAILAAVVLIAINPARQFGQANNSQRSSNVNAILNAIGQYMADNKGQLPPALTSLAANSTSTIASTGGTDLCAVLVPTYLPALPVDPTITTGSVTNCASYSTGYAVVKDSANRITVLSTTTDNGVGTIKVTR